MNGATKQYLVTTHDQGTWPSGAPLVLIDSGLQNNSVSEHLVRSTEICPIDERLNRHHQLSNLCSELLEDLTTYLNAMHNERSSAQTWKIRLGLWLHHFVDTVYERWLAVSDIEQQFPSLSTELFPIDPQTICPKQSFDFYPISQSAQWNHWVTGEIAKFNKQIEVINSTRTHQWQGGSPSDTYDPSFKSQLRHSLRSSLLQIGLTSRHILATTYLPRKTELFLALRMKSLPTIWSEPMVPRAQFNIKMRNSMDFPKTSDSSFNAFIRSIICSQVPRSMVEDYSALSRKANSGRFARTPRTIFTANLHVTSDLFCIWMSHKQLQGSQILLGQHGGQYGQVAPPTRTEEHEIATTNRYFSWGWRTNDRHIVPAPAMPLVNVSPSSPSVNSKNSLLLITDCTSRYARRPWPISSDNDHYLNNLFRFVDSLPSDRRSLLRVRLHHDHAKYDFSHSTRWLDRFPHINLDSGQGPLSRLRSQARLIVCTSLGTSELEQLAANQPTLLLLNHDVHPVRTGEQAVFAELENSQVLFQDGLALAKHVQEIWNDVEAWWSSTLVQRSIDLYKDHFVHQSADPISFFQREILATVKKPT
jgi:putative transferase (TIGR04331 family)